MSDPLTVTAGVVGVASFAVQSITALVRTIESVRDAPATIANLSGDLKTTRDVIHDLKSNISSPVLRPEVRAYIDGSSSLKDAVAFCSNDGTTFEGDLKRWMRHSNAGKLARRDRIQIGIFAEKRIESFGRRLAQGLTIVNLALTNAVFLNTCDSSEVTQEQRALVESKRNEMAIACQQAQHDMREVEGQLAAVSLQTEKGAVKDGKVDQLDEDVSEQIGQLHQELKLLQTRVQFSQEVMQRLPVEQKISDIQMDDNSKIMAGLINVDGENYGMKQDISGVSATKNSRGIVGVARNVNLDNFWD